MDNRNTTVRTFLRSLTESSQYFEWLGVQLGFNSMEDWYNINIDKVVKHGGRNVLTVYNGSAMRAVQNVYPEHKWLPWKFETVPLGFWEKIDNQRQFFDWLAEQLGYKTYEDWYQVGNPDIYKWGGHSLMKCYYGASVPRALRAIYPEHHWQLWNFKNISKRFWRSKNNHKIFLEWLVNDQLPHGEIFLAN